MSKVELRFYRGSGLVAWLIRWFTNSQFDHVAPVVNCLAWDARWGSGVTHRVAFPDNDWARVTISTSDAEAKKWETWLEQQVGKPYDKWAIVLIVAARFLPDWLHLSDTRQGVWWCSHLSAVVAGLATETDLGHTPITPGALWERVRCAL